jgi:hypothetical protein
MLMIMLLLLLLLRADDKYDEARTVCAGRLALGVLKRAHRTRIAVLGATRGLKETDGALRTIGLACHVREGSRRTVAAANAAHAWHGAARRTVRAHRLSNKALEATGDAQRAHRVAFRASEGATGAIETKEPARCREVESCGALCAKNGVEAVAGGTARARTARRAARRIGKVTGAALNALNVTGVGRVRARRTIIAKRLTRQHLRATGNARIARGLSRSVCKCAGVAKSARRLPLKVVKRARNTERAVRGL